MTSVVVYRVFPGAVAEVKQVVPVALIFLLSHSYEVVGKYPDLSASASPEDYDIGDIVAVSLIPVGMELQLQSRQLQVINPEVPTPNLIGTNPDILISSSERISINLARACLRFLRRGIWTSLRSTLTVVIGSGSDTVTFASSKRPS